MKQSTIQYRPFQSSDYQGLEDIIRKTWDYDRLGRPKSAHLLAKIYLASCLVNQTFTCVAVSNGEPVGVIMGKNRKTHRKPLRFFFRQSIAIAQIAISQEIRNISKIFSKVDQANDNLLKNVNLSFDAELAFFAVRDDQRGKGIGSDLYQHFLDYIASEHLETFFLFTDTTSHYRFYEHQGLQRLAEDTLDIPQFQENMHLYIYGQI